MVAWNAFVYAWVGLQWLRRPAQDASRRGLLRRAVQVPAAHFQVVLTDEHHLLQRRPADQLAVEQHLVFFDTPPELRA